MLTNISFVLISLICLIWFFEDTDHTLRLIPCLLYLSALCTDTTNCPHQLSRRDLYVYGDYCLKVHYGNWDWETARKICIREGGDLVQPRTARMQEFIRVNLLPQKQKSEEDGFWIGATDLNSESHWRWVSGNELLTSIVFFFCAFIITVTDCLRKLLGS